LRVRRLVPIALTLLLASCTGAATIPAPSVSAEYEGTPSLATSLPTPTASLTVAPPASPRAVGEGLASARVDFDCDGKADRLQFFTLIAAKPGDANRVAQLTLATGAVHELMLVASVDGAPLLGTADVNGDGCDDAIVSLDRGASTTQATFLVYDRGELRLVQEDGRPATFFFGGSVRHGNAIECRRTKDAAEIVARGVSDYTSDFEWDAIEDVHRWATKSELVLWSTTRSVIVVSVRYAMPPDEERYWALSCGSLKFGH
jgi:hypothetical protein